MKQKLNLIMFISVFSLALLGGISYLPLFKFGLSVDEGFFVMSPLTSILFLVTILASLVWVKYTRRFYRYKKHIALAILIVALFGLLEIVGYFIEVENFLTLHFGYLDGIPFSKMSPVTGVFFSLTSCVLLILLNQNNKSEISPFINLIKNIFTTVLSLTSLLFIVTYLYKSPLSYNTQNMTPMALSTSVGFLCVSGILIINDKKNYLMEMFTNASPSTTLIRFITPFTFISVFVIGLAQYYIFTVNPVKNSTFLSAFFLTLLAVMSGFMAIFLTKKLMAIEDKNSKNLHQYKSMVILSSSMQALLDDNFVYLAVNQAYVDKLNLTIEQVVGKNLRDIFGKKYFESEFISSAKRCLAGEVVKQKKWMKFASGQRLFIDLEMAPYYKDNGNIYGILVNARDITELKDYQDNLEKLKRVIDNSSVIAFRCRPDENWSVEHISSNIGLLGYQAKNLLSGQVNFADMVHPQDLPRVKKEIECFTQRGLENFTQEYRIVSPSGKVFWVDDRSTIERDDDGIISFFQGVIIDITYKKQHEKLLNRTQKNDSLGQLTGGIAHDYNNVLGVVIGYSDILKAQLKEQPMLLNFADQINQAGNRGAQLTHKLLSFSRQTPDSSQQSNINSLIKNNKDVLRKTLLSVELKLNLNDDISQVDIDRNSFEDALLNMAINSMHAMPQGGVLTLSTSEVKLSKEQARSFNVSQGKYVQLSIEDNGEGMSNVVQNKIFDPFFSTKGDQGSGLGLAQVYGFMKSSMGAINVYSTLEEGTRFLLYFPIPTDTNKEKSIKDNKKENLRVQGNESILVVDDEPQLRTLIQEILTAKGYRVLTATNGIDALEVLDKNAIDLMLSDIIMPKMNGYLLVEKAQKLYPQLKILLASGFQGNQADNKLKLDEAIIEKPYENEFLLRRIRRCLDKQYTNSYQNSGKVVQNKAQSSQVKKLIWTNDISIDDGGILDEDHQSLFLLFNRCQDLLEEDDFQQPLKEIITELVQYTQEHFAREELAMKRCHYPYAKNHCDVHQMMVKKLTQKLFTCSDKEILLWLNTEMSEWLVDHIKVMDKPLHKYLVKRKQEENGLEGNAEGDVLD